MSDYINRLIQRASGRMPVIEPALRSGYEAFPRVIETAAEFEEAIAFDNDAETHEPLTQATARVDTESSPIAVKPLTHETGDAREAGDKTRVAEGADALLHPGRRWDKPSPGSPGASDTAVLPGGDSTRIGAAAKPAPEVEKEGFDVDLVVPVARKTPVRHVERIIRDGEMIDRYGETVDEPQPATANKINIIDEGPRYHDMKVTPAREISDTGQTDVVELQRAEQPTRSIWKEESNLEPKTEEPPDTIQPASLVPGYMQEAGRRRDESLMPGGAGFGDFIGRDVPSSRNIQVTIGRVEIRAVREPEHRPQPAPAAPREPAVSLDVYLERRDGERR
ncbi:MAG: hypothetical protein SWK76_11190 [Actinomycetota bacterium]|nr:hypothetical protein [Actinomycetota bacterium]